MIFSVHHAAPLQCLSWVLGMVRPESKKAQGANVKKSLSNHLIFCLLAFSWLSLHIYDMKEFLCVFRNEGGEVSVKGQNPENGPETSL